MLPLSRARATLAVVASWAAFHAAMLFTSGVPYERDILTTVLPLRQYMKERLLAGEWPQWYPYELLGVPFSGNPVASPFHPQALLFLLLSPAVANKWCLLLASLFGLTGAYRLARELGASRPGALAGAWVFGFGGFATSLISNPPSLVPLLTAPWFLAAAHRLTGREVWRDVAAAAVWWALIFLGGDVQLFLACGLLGVAVVLVHGFDSAAPLRFIAAGALTACLVSGEMLPALALESESVHAGWRGGDLLGRIWAFSPWRLADFLLPNFIPLQARLEAGHQLEGAADLFASSVFIGVPAMILACFGGLRRHRSTVLWVVVALLGLWLSFGYDAGLLRAWWTILPPFAKFRFPERYLALLVLALIPLVARGFDVVVQAPRHALVSAGTAGVTMLVFAFVPAFRGWSVSLLWSGAELIVFAVLLHRIGVDQRATIGVPLLLFGALWIGNGGRTPLAPAAVVNDPGQFARTLEELRLPGEPPPRVLPGRGTSQQLTDADLVRQIHLWMLADDAGRGHAAAWNENSAAERKRVLDLLSDRDSPKWRPRFGVCYRVADESSPARGHERVLSHVDTPSLDLVRTNCGPRAYLASHVLLADDERDARRTLRDLPIESAVWEHEPGMVEGGGTVRWLVAEPEYLKLDVTAAVDSGLIVSDAYANGWTATVDANAVRIHAANVAARGLIVPVGHHIVEMRYSAPGLLPGVALMLAGGLSCLALLVLSGHRRRRTAI